MLSIIRRFEYNFGRRTILPAGPAPAHLITSVYVCALHLYINMASSAISEFYLGPWSIEIAPSQTKLTISAYSNSGERFSLTVADANQLAHLNVPGFYLPSFEALQKCVEFAVQKKENLSASVEKCKENELSLVLVQNSPVFGESKLSLELVKVTQMLETRLENISSFISTWTKDRLSSQETCKHANLTVFHNGLAVVKHTGGNGHVSVSTGKPFTYGKHYFEVKIIRCTSNACMVGVQSSLSPLTPYPGLNPFATGKAIYGNNGYCYRDNTNADYGLGGFGPGDYVGLLLDMNEKKVTFFINGRKGAPMDLQDPTGTYYFMINVHTVGDCVEFLPQYCWHE